MRTYDAHIRCVHIVSWYTMCYVLLINQPNIETDRTHNNLLHLINLSLPIDVTLEKRSIKYMDRDAA